MPNCNQRRGAVIPLFAFLLPVLMIFCAMAINLAYMQLANTEMQIAVDVAVHAGGRRLGTPVANDDGTVQSLAETKSDVLDFAADIAALNNVAGRPAEIPESQMEFGRSTRVQQANGQFSSYEFFSINENQIPSSFRIVSNNLELPFVFGPFSSSNGFRPSSKFHVSANSVSTQVDRDVVLVMDRSGSMIYFEDEGLLNNTLNDILDETYTEEGETLFEYRVQFQRLSSGITWRNSGLFGYLTQAEFDVTSFPTRNEYRLNYDDERVREHIPDMVHEKITQSEYDEARDGLYDRWYSSNLIYWLEVAESQRDDPDVDNDTWQHTLGDDPRTWTSDLTVDEQRAQLRGHMALYAHDYRYRYRLEDPTIDGDEDLDSRDAPIYSRWYHLERGVAVFLNVLGGGVDPDGTARDGTVQKEQIAILPFNSDPNNQTNSEYYNSEFDYELQDDGFPSAFVNNSNEPGYAEPYGSSTLSLRDVLGTICPYGGTAIGDSLRTSVPIIRSSNENAGGSSDRARPFAAKTIVVLTDGDNTVGDNPVTVAQQEIANEDVLVHTITFTPGVSNAGRTAMQEVAAFGKGRHYHTDSGDELARIFEQIANNLPTILTQ